MNRDAVSPSANGPTYAPEVAPSGYHATTIAIDVGSEAVLREPLHPTLVRSFLGGSGLGTALLLQRGAASFDPLEPAAPLVFAFSPLVGSPLTTSAKFAVVSKSPLTNRLNDSLASSGFAIAGKKCGCDALVLVGRASRPSIVLIDDGQVRFESADDIWGKSIPDAQRMLEDRFGSSFRFAIIGPAGEQLVRFATISHDGRHAGRGGSGAVLGSKNIKAVGVRGSQTTAWSNPAALSRYAKELSERSFGPATAKYRELGTATNLLAFNRLHTLPTRNFQQASIDDAERLAPETLAIVREKTQTSCAACTIGCEHVYGFKRPQDGAVASTRLEYENLFALGPLCGIVDPDVVLAASQACDELGLDTISTGGTIAFAMECVERGLLQEEWLRFGSGDALLNAIHMIATRDGLGDDLAEGSRRFAATVGNDAHEFAAHVKGLEMPGYEPRTLQTMALGLSVNARGADHNRSSAYEADFSTHVDRHSLSYESVAHAIATEDRAVLMDSMILCKFLRGVFTDFYAEAAQMLQLTTGWHVTPDELHITANRILNAKKYFNQLAGWTPAEDTLPVRFLKDALADAPDAKLSVSVLRMAIEEYNRQRHWTDTGYLTPAQIAELKELCEIV